jgi:hypothetical protein
MPKNFLIVGTQRTGTQAIYAALNSHPDIVCGGEWTQHVIWPRKVKMAKRALDGDFHSLISGRPHLLARYTDSLTPQTKWLGFKILFSSSDKWIGHPRFAPALMKDRLGGHLRWLRSRPDVHIIQTIRRETIDWLKSKYVARYTGLYTNKQYPEGTRLDIPIWAAMRAADAKDWVDTQLASLASTNPYHLVYYEDFLADNRKEVESCLGFLRCDPKEMPDGEVFRKRQSKGSAADYILNYRELVAALEHRESLAQSRT